MADGLPGNVSLAGNMSSSESLDSESDSSPEELESDSLEARLDSRLVFKGVVAAWKPKLDSVL